MIFDCKKSAVSVTMYKLIKKIEYSKKTYNPKQNVKMIPKPFDKLFSLDDL